MNDPSDEFREFDLSGKRDVSRDVIVYRGIRHDIPYSEQKSGIVNRTREREWYLRHHDSMYFASMMPDGGALEQEAPRKKSFCHTFSEYISGSNRHEFDLYLPREGADTSKLVVHVHGGGWHRGKNDVFWRGGPAAASTFAAMGYPSIAVTYRQTTPSMQSAPVYGLIVGLVLGGSIAALASVIVMIISAIGAAAGSWSSTTELQYIVPYLFYYTPLGFFSQTVCGCLLILLLREKVKVKDQLDDIIDSVRYLQDNAHEWGLAPTEVILSGHSAGAHLSTYLSLEPELQQRAHISQHNAFKVPTSWMKLKGVISISGLYNLRDGPCQQTIKNQFFYACYSSGAIGYTSKEQFKYSPVSLLVRYALQKPIQTYDCAWLNQQIQAYSQETHVLNSSSTLEVAIPPIYVVNAEKDVSIDYDGLNFVLAAQCLSKDACRSVAKGTSHANIAFNVGRHEATRWILGKIHQYFNNK